LLSIRTLTAALHLSVLKAPFFSVQTVYVVYLFSDAHRVFIRSSKIQEDYGYETSGNIGTSNGVELLDLFQNEHE